ncbi:MULTISPECIES: hypothetical protein [Bacteroides]|jgi:antitoxin component YwqK of YwqJK toxin-antitoxin module|uniref:hypothetical protein n=1 Tax=Bacteroides TaxID=816 RepID=UPI00189DD644|nr:hypothetical protein [Bacteroides nordii]MCE8464454.1 hypothetical protein [Bacteroides nordii]UYU48099.1 hypothetical protein KQP55_15635 [Bacteroides nordii]
MKINFLILFVAFFFLSYFDAVAQKGYVDEINQVNNEGQKEGFWKENVNEHFRTETYYHKGKKNGIYKMFNTVRNELVSMGEYKNDIETGIWYIFGDYGHLLMMQSDFQKNTYQIPLEHHAQGICPYRCYSISFHPNGSKKSEGILLWDKSADSDFVFEYGEWKYYDESGELTKIKEFK